MRDEILFRNEAADITVTSQWLSLGNQSHAIHYLRRLTLDKSSPPRKLAMVVFFVGVLLTIIQIIQILRDTLPPAIAWVLLLACICLMIVSSYIAFVQTDKRKLIIDFNDGESLQLSLPGSSSIVQLHAALQQAMNVGPDRKKAAMDSIVKELESP